MRRTTALLSLVVLMLLVGIVVGTSLRIGPAQAQVGGGYDLTWNSVDGGGVTFGTGGGYSLGGTAGQPDAGLLQGGGYTLGGGFWRGGALRIEHRIYLPLSLKAF